MIRERILWISVLVMLVIIAANAVRGLAHWWAR
jgi:hypothetical protein